MKGTCAFFVLSALMSLPAFADDSAPSPAPAATRSAPARENEPRKAAKKADPKPAAGSSNLIVAKDPETGELRPATAAEREQLLGRRPLVAPEPEIVTFPDGTVMMKVRPEDADMAVATRNADGTLSYACVHGADAARAAVAPAPAPSPSPAPKKADR